MPSHQFLSTQIDILGLIRELKIENPILLGYSMGAFIAAIVASKLKSTRAENPIRWCSESV